MQFYLRSNMKLYQDIGAEYLFNVTDGVLSKMETRLLKLFPDLFILKWDTKDD